MFIHPGSLFLLTFMLGLTPAARPQDPPGAIARVNGEELSLEGFRDWVVRTHGWRHFDDYIELSLLRQEATRIGLALPTPSDLETAFESDWKDQILWRHRGVESEFEKELAASGLDRQGYRDRRLGTLEQEVVARSILRQQPLEPDRAKELWTREFGEKGVRTHVRVAFFDKLKNLVVGEQGDRAQVQAGEEVARKRADAFHEAVAQDRAKFAELVKDSDLCTEQRFDSIPIDLRTRGGDVPRLRADHFNGLLEQPLVNAKAGDLLGPIDTPRGWFVVEVFERSPVTFEAVQEELAAIWRDRMPSQGEIYWLKDQLKKQASIERFALQPPPDPVGR